MEYSIQHLYGESQQKNTRTTCQTSLKLTIKAPKQFLFLTWDMFTLYSTVITAEFEQLCWLGLRNFSFRQ